MSPMMQHTVKTKAVNINCLLISQIVLCEINGLTNW
jgi:hypothetical protein